MVVSVKNTNKTEDDQSLFSIGLLVSNSTFR